MLKRLPRGDFQAYRGLESGVLTTIFQNAPPFKAGPVEFPRGKPIQQGGDEWHPLSFPPPPSRG
jgi:hypothetical protein